ncbi:MAG: metallophosphoesterase [Clostridia bacterium]|nr:metallophosphoesterase [Clostridia bacterium]
MKKRLFSTVSLLLLLALVFTAVFPAFAAEDDSISILACSDFQAPDGNAQGRTQVTAILSAMKRDGITSADGFFCCGDYDYEYTDTRGGINTLKNTVRGVVSENTVFVQGNHDSPIGTNGLSDSGNNDPANGKYGVFVINEDDYMWYNSDEDTVKRTAQELIDYLNQKLAEGYSKPIFVLSHLGLHYSMRTQLDGDCKYAYYLFDVLNEAAKKGLNLFYLYGHNHSNGWDDYLGGAAVYLQKGDTMLVGQGSNISFNKKTLAFTYLNAGYTGYYSNVNNQDDALTMTYLTITADSVTVTRYDKNGKHAMKSQGISNAYHNEVRYQPNTDTYPSPQTVSLTAVSDKTPIKNLLTIDKTLPAYRKLTSLDEIKDGGKYLLVQNSAPDRVMLPKGVVKANSSGSERIGFDVSQTADFGSSIAYSNIADALWTFTKTDGGWKLGSSEGYVTYEATANQGIAAKFAPNGSVFTVEGSQNAFTFTADNYVFNYNARTLINFYTSDPAAFYLYEPIGYAVTVEGGSAAANGNKITHAHKDTALTLSPTTAPDGYRFDHWEVTKGTLDLGDPTAATLTVTMPDHALSIKAVYEKAPVVTTAVVTTDPPTTDTPTTETPNGEQPNDFPTAACVIIAVVFASAAAVTVIILYRKKKAR